MLILAFDTSGSILSIALLLNQKILDETIIIESSKQSELLIVEIEKILLKNKIYYQDLDLITTINGPGSFTGVRVGLVAARTIKLATKKPLICLNSCEVLANKYKNETKNIIVILDAGMDEFFGAEFLVKNGILRTVQESKLLTREDLINFPSKDEFFLCGLGKKVSGEIFNQKYKNFTISKDDDLITARLVGLLSYEKNQNLKKEQNSDPLYLRMPRIEKRKK